MSASFRSNAKRRRRSQLQNRSIGFRSGERGGMCQSATPAAVCASLTAGLRRNFSLSQRTTHGLRRFPLALLTAARSFPLLTIETQSPLHNFFQGWKTTGAKPRAPTPPPQRYASLDGNLLVVDIATCQGLRVRLGRLPPDMIVCALASSHTCPTIDLGSNMSCLVCDGKAGGVTKNMKAYSGISGCSLQA